MRAAASQSLRVDNGHRRPTSREDMSGFSELSTRRGRKDTDDIVLP